MLQLTNIEELLWNISQQLVANDDLVKLLHFNSSDALSKDIGTYNGVDYRVDHIRNALLYNYKATNEVWINGNKVEITPTIFFSPPSFETLETEGSQLRIYVEQLAVDHPYLAQIAITLQVIIHDQLWLLDNFKQRPLSILHRIFQSINDISTNSVGALALYQDNLKKPLQFQKYNRSFSGYNLTIYTRGSINE